MPLLARVRFLPSALIAFLFAALPAETALGWQAAPAAQTAPESGKDGPSIEKYLRIRAPGSPVTTPNDVLYCRDWPAGVNQLCSRAPNEGLAAQPTPVTRLKDGVNSFTLAPNGQKIVFAAAEGGNELDSLYLFELVSRNTTTLLTKPKVVYALQVWLPDSRGFIYTANDVNSADFYIYRYDIATKQSKKLLAKSGQWRVTDISRDGYRLLVQQYFSESLADAFVLDTNSNVLTPLNIGATPSYNEPVAFMPGDNTMMVISDSELGISRLFIRNPEAAQTPSKPLPDLEKFPIEGVTTNEDHSLAAVTYNEGGYGSMRLVSLPDFATIPVPAQEKGVVGSVEFRDKTLFWTLSNARNPGIGYSWTVGSTEGIRQITSAFTQGIDLAAFPLPELITYKSFDGLEIPAFLYTPPGWKKGTPIPFIVNYHGGPEGQSRPGFSALNQFLLASGYGVLQPNVRGSTGYGRAFHMMDDYKKRWDSVKDGVEAARWLVAQAYAKPGKIAAYGGSYGGFMAVATVIEGGDLFGAGVDVVGIVNMKTFLEQTSDYRRKLREAEYGPLTDPAFLASISSINRIDDIKCPMLIAHGLNDPRVPVGEAMQLAVGLQSRGFDPELLFFPDEGHGFAKLKNRLLFARRMVKFLHNTIGQ